MKKWMFLAVLCLPMALMAQNRGGAQSPKETAAQKTAAFEQRLTAEVVIQQRGSLTAITLDMGTAPETIFRADKLVTGKLKSLESSRFTNAVDAMNALTQLGFRMDGSYTTGDGAAAATHIVFSKKGRASAPMRNAGDKAAPATDSKTSSKSKKK